MNKKNKQSKEPKHIKDIFSEMNISSATNIHETTSSSTTENIADMLQDYAVIIHMLDTVHTQAAKLLQDIDAFYFQEKEQLSKNIQSISAGKLDTKAIHTIQEQIYYIRNELEIEYIDIKESFEMAINLFDNEEDKVEYQKKINEFDVLYRKIYTDIENDICKVYDKYLT